MYKLYNSTFSGVLAAIIRVADGAFIPLDPGNADYRAYLAWVAAGNTPLPAES